MQLTQRGVEMIPSKVKETLTYILNNNDTLSEQGMPILAVNVEGPAGIGKTSLLSQIAKERKKRFIKINLAQLDELGDLVGFPYTAYEMKYPDGTTKWLPETPSKLAVNKEKASYTGRTKMDYARPAWLEDNIDAEHGAMLVLDDFSRAQPRFIQAAMEIIDRGEYYSWKLPKDWTIVLTTNPSGEGYHVAGMDMAQQTRYGQINMMFDEKDWAEWAENTGIDGRCINFVLMYPEMITEGIERGINPRTAVQFFGSIHNLQDFDTSESRKIINRMGEMTVGQEFTHQFVMFVNNNEDKLITPEQIMFDPWDTVEKTLREALYQKGGNYSGAVGFALSIRLVNYLTKYVLDHTFTDDMADRLEAITLAEIFPKDINYQIVRSLNHRNAVKFKKFCNRISIAKYNLQ